MGDLSEAIFSNTLVDIVVENARRLKHKTAITNGKESISYAKLLIESTLLAEELARHHVEIDEPVGIVCNAPARHIIAQVTVVLAGGACLPLDPARRDDEIRNQLELMKAKTSIIDDAARAKCFSSITSVITYKATDTHQQRPFQSPLRDATSSRTHILFTSGTTGTPKTVEVPTQGILRVAYDATCRPASGDQVFGHLNNVCFDISLIDIWVSLVHGATTVTLDRKEITNVDYIVESIKTLGVTYLVLPTALFHLTASSSPSAFGNLETLVVAVESMDVSACKNLSTGHLPKRLINAYGPAECSIFATTHVVTPEDLAKTNIPIGKPVNETLVYLLDESQHPVSRNDVGEIYLGGVGLSRGYLYNPHATQERFIPNSLPGHSEDMLYRTGDLAYMDEKGDLVWVGRRDREVKIRGYRVNLDKIEAELLSTGLVGSVAVTRLSPSNSSAALLAAAVTFTSPEITNEDILAQARLRLPTYMVPLIVTFESLPLTHNGKLDRKEPERMMLEIIQHLIRSETPEVPIDAGGLEKIEAELRALWVKTLYIVPAQKIGPKSDFFELGGTSMQVGSLITGIRDTLGILLSARDVYKNSTLGSLASWIFSRQDASLDEDTQELRQELLADVDMLTSEIPVPSQPAVNWLADDEGNVFLTGATGFVGAYLLVELVQIPQVKVVRCLVRATSVQSAWVKLENNLIKYRLGDILKQERHKIDVICGDITHDRLGLSQPLFEELAGWASIIYHFGAQVNYNEPYHANRAANVIGTRNILQLAVTGKIKTVHNASAIAVFGPTGLISPQLEPLSEDDPLDRYLDKTILYDMGYSQSKWVADKALLNLMQRGFPAATYRFGTALSSSKDGVCNPEDFISRLLVDCLARGTYPIISNSREELIPVDYAATVVRYISQSNSNLGKAYHITPDPGLGIDTIDLFIHSGKIRGVAMKGMAFNDWVSELEKDVRNGADLRLAPLLPAIQDKIYGDLAIWQVYENMARFRTDNVKMALSKAGVYETIRSADINVDDLKIYLEYLLSHKQLQ